MDGAVAAVDDGQGRNTKKPEVLLDWSFDVVLESHVKDVFYHQDVLPLFQRAFSDNCLPDGSYTCPQCGGPLTINHDQARCNGTCKPKPGKKLTLFSYFDLYILASGKGGEKPLKFYSALYQLAARRSWVISHSALKEDQDNLRRSVEYAFGYMKSGFWPVLNHRVVNGACTCKERETCGTPGKHPLVTAWQREPPTKQSILAQFSAQNMANIGLALGSKRGFLVLDIDGEIGEDSLLELQFKYGDLPETVTAHTGGGGRHLWFHWPPGAEIRGNSSIIGEKVDIRAEDNQVIVEPSIHASGNPYRWDKTYHPDCFQIAAMPDEWVEALKNARKAPAKGPGGENLSACDFADVLNGVPDGQKGDTISRWGLSKRVRGNTAQEVELLVRSCAAHCDTPFEESRIASTLKSIERKYQEIEEKKSDKKTALEDANKLLENFEAQYKADPGWAFKKETLAAIKTVQAARGEDWGRLLPIFKRLSLKLEIKKALNGLRIADDNPPPIFTVAKIFETVAPALQLPDGCDKFVLPGTFGIANEGTIFLKSDENKNLVVTPVCPTWILVTKQFSDIHTGEEKVELTWFDHQRVYWRSIIAPRSNVVDSSALVKLADQGCPSSSSVKGLLARFLFEFLMQNEQEIPVERISSVMGWIVPGKSFLCGNELICCDGQEQVTFQGLDAGNNQLAKGFVESGDYDAWAEGLKPAMVYPHARCALYASFAAILVELLNTDNVVIDFSHDSSTGKTTLLEVGASVWGNPRKESLNPVPQTWDSTRIALEGTCATLRNLPAIFDDTKNLARNADLGNMVYGLASGQGRGRGSKQGQRASLHWRTVILSSGEAPLTSFAQHAGTRARVLSITGPPFGEGNTKETGQLVGDIKIGIYENYGHAGRRFVKWLIGNYHRLKEFKDRLKAKEVSFPSSNAISGRLAKSMALISVAGELAHEALGLPWAFDDPCLKFWDRISQESEDAPIYIRSLQDLYDYCLSHREDFLLSGEPYGGGDQNRHNPRNGWLGRWDSSESWRTIDFIPQQLTRILTELGYNPIEALTGFKEHGCLDLPESQKKRFDAPKSFNGKLYRVTPVRREALECPQELEEPATTTTEVVASAEHPVQFDPVCVSCPACLVCNLEARFSAGEDINGHCLRFTWMPQITHSLPDAEFEPCNEIITARGPGFDLANLPDDDFQSEAF